MRLLALGLIALAPCVDAMRMAINCSTTADCNDGETCVAGDSALSIQACVVGTGCGGSTTGNCPSDADSGTLSCIWQASSGCSSSTGGCAEMGGNYGIYKCLSIDRCDEYYGGSACSDGCNVNGAQCNNQGSYGASNNNTPANPSAASGSVASESSSGGTSSAVFIIIGVLAACIIIGALMFAMYSRKKKREQEAEAGGFGGAAAFGATARFDNESAIAGGTGADTPKSSIVTM
ncbi:hypothetical protein BBJ29_009372 [Phytophthora kernoviae]|uniref:EGF-like domain-containing protein n=1 Tax=Phytophthora kernoviae TaxID=325452 RepID=A0A3F2RUU3_9STRA|nr:hypothetical protein BBJ29_009372 [Phytophthora kernoviae]RLN64689.1 hypothetical protein BBP00_00003295 [Phytophthora kernoviae]